MLAQQLVNGVLLGATYALFALGFTLMFGVLRVINLTYGFYFSAGALVALWLAREAGLGIWLALPLAALASGALFLQSFFVPFEDHVSAGVLVAFAASIAAPVSASRVAKFPKAASEPHPARKKTP